MTMPRCGYLLGWFVCFFLSLCLFFMVLCGLFCIRPVYSLFFGYTALYRSIFFFIGIFLLFILNRSYLIVLGYHLLRHLYLPFGYQID